MVAPVNLIYRLIENYQKQNLKTYIKHKYSTLKVFWNNIIWRD